MNNQMEGSLNIERRTVYDIISHILLINFLVFLTMMVKVDGKLYIHVALNAFIFMEIASIVITVFTVGMQSRKKESRNKSILYFIVAFILVLVMAYLTGVNDIMTQSIRIPFLLTEILLLAAGGGIQLILKATANK